MSEEYGKTKIKKAIKDVSDGGNNYTKNHLNAELETFESSAIEPLSTYLDFQGNQVNSYSMEDTYMLLQDSPYPVTGLENSFYNCTQKRDANGRLITTDLYLYDGYDVLSTSEKQTSINSRIFLPTYFIQNVELGTDAYTIYIDSTKSSTGETLTFKVPAGLNRQSKDLPIAINQIYSIQSSPTDVTITYRNGYQETYDYNGNCTGITTSVPEGFEAKGSYISSYDNNLNRYDFYQKENVGQLCQNQNFTISNNHCSNISRGYRCMNAEGDITESAIEFTNDIPRLFFRGKSLTFRDMQISFTDQLDISLEENGYHIYMKEKQDGDIATPDGFYINCKYVEDIAVTDEETVIHLFGGGYLKYDKDGKVTEQQLPVYNSSNKLPGILSFVQDAYNYLKNSFLSWPDFLVPMVSDYTTKSNGYQKHYYAFETSEGIWKQKGIEITGLEPYYKNGYQIYDLDNRLDTTAIRLSDFDQYMAIRGTNFSIDGLLRVPVRDVEEVEFNQDFYKIHLKPSESKRDYLKLSTVNVTFSLDEISDITVYLDTCDIRFQDGRTLTLDADGKMMSYTGDWNWEKDSIYSNKSVYTGQYGGNQMDFSNRADELLEDEWVQNYFKQNFPNSNSLDQYLYLRQICEVGCSYVAASNMIFDQFEGKEEEFKKIFGYDMYKIDENGFRDYNYEYLSLEFFTYVWKDLHGLDITQMSTDIEDLVHTNETDTILDALDDETVNHYFHTFSGFDSAEDRVQDVIEFFKKKTSNYQMDGEVMIHRQDSSITDEEIEMIEEALEDGKSVSIGAGNYDLYEINPTTFDKGKIYQEDGGGHAMSVTEVTDDGEIVVSSWGTKYIVDLSDFSYLHVDAYEIQD